MFVSIVNVKPGDMFRFMSISGDVITRRVVATVEADPEYAMSWKDKAYLIKVRDFDEIDGLPLFYDPASLVVWDDNESCWETVYWGWKVNEL